MISHAVVIFEAHRVLCRLRAVLGEPLRIDIDAARRLQHHPGIELLAFFRQEPVDENFRRGGMRRIFDDAERAVGVARRQPFARLRQLLHRQAFLDEGLELRVADAERERELSFRQRVGDLPEIPAYEQILARELFEILLTLDVPEKRPKRKARARYARIAEADPAFPLGIEQIVERADLDRKSTRLNSS